MLSTQLSFFFYQHHFYIILTICSHSQFLRMFHLFYPVVFFSSFVKIFSSRWFLDHRVKLQIARVPTVLLDTGGEGGMENGYKYPNHHPHSKSPDNRWKMFGNYIIETDNILQVKNHKWKNKKNLRLLQRGRNKIERKTLLWMQRKNC